MNTKYLRWVGALTIAGLLAFFFIPFLYNATLISCPVDDCIMTNTAGLESWGLLLFNWGASYSYSSGGLSTYGFGNLSLVGVFLTYIFPAIVACVCLISPELIGRSRLTRASFAGFGAFVSVVSVLLALSSTLPFTVIGIVLVPTGAYMAAFGVWPWLLLVEKQAPGQEVFP